MHNKITALRKEIDKIDLQILQMLQQRCALSAEIGKNKYRMGLPVHNPQREKDLVRNLQTKAVSYQIDPAMIQSLWKIIFNNSLQIQETEYRNYEK